MVTGVSRRPPSSGPTSGKVQASPLEKPGGAPDTHPEPAAAARTEVRSSERRREVFMATPGDALTTVRCATPRDLDESPTGAHRGRGPARPAHRGRHRL